MDSKTGIVRTFTTEIHAEIAKAILNANGVAALVQTNDAAGLLRQVTGVHLVVLSEDIDLAREILDSQGGETLTL